MSLLSVSKLKLILPYYLPYLDAFPGIIVPPTKQTLKLILATLTPSAAPPASSTCSWICTANITPVSNTCTCLCTTSVTPEASVNKYRKLSAPLLLGPLKPS